MHKNNRDNPLSNWPTSKNDSLSSQRWHAAKPTPAEMTRCQTDLPTGMTHCQADPNRNDPLLSRPQQEWPATKPTSIAMTRCRALTRCRVELPVGMTHCQANPNRDDQLPSWPTNLDNSNCQMNLSSRSWLSLDPTFSLATPIESFPLMTLQSRLDASWDQVPLLGAIFSISLCAICNG